MNANVRSRFAKGDNLFVFKWFVAGVRSVIVLIDHSCRHVSNVPSQRDWVQRIDLRGRQRVVVIGRGGGVRRERRQRAAANAQVYASLDTFWMLKYFPILVSMHMSIISYSNARLLKPLTPPYAYTHGTCKCARLRAFTRPTCPPSGCSPLPP
jgi:hypothetical protein